MGYRVWAQIVHGKVIPFVQKNCYCSTTFKLNTFSFPFLKQEKLRLVLDVRSPPSHRQRNMLERTLQLSLLRYCHLSSHVLPQKRENWLNGTSLLSSASVYHNIMITRHNLLLILLCGLLLGAIAVIFDLRLDYRSVSLSCGQSHNLLCRFMVFSLRKGLIGALSLVVIFAASFLGHLHHRDISHYEKNNYHQIANRKRTASNWTQLATPIREREVICKSFLSRSKEKQR